MIEAFATAPIAAAGVQFLPFAGGGTLFYAGSNRLWVLNHTSAFIWCLLAEGRSGREIARRLMERYGIDADTARRDFAAVEKTFQREKLFTPDRLPPAPAEEPFFVPPAVHLAGDLPAYPFGCFFGTPGQLFAFGCAEDFPGAAFARMLSPLLLPTGQTASVQLAVLPAAAPEKWDIELDRRKWLTGVPPDEVVPHLLKVVFVRACEALAERLLFHAAVLGGDERAVIFPAPAGCGKTTLAATLAARGHRFYSDELAVLHREELRLTPLPLPMSIKPGSTAVLERRYPGLADQPVHQRADGQRVRYLAPPPAQTAPGDLPPAAVEALVFPRFEKNAVTRLLPLDKPTALQKLAQTGSSNRPLTAADVAAMIALVETSPCFCLDFSDVEEAAHRLEENFASFSR